MACKLYTKFLKIAAKRKLFCSSSYFGTVRPKALIGGKREGSSLTSARGEGTERPFHSARGASLPPTPSRDSRGPGETGRREAHPGDAPGDATGDNTHPRSQPPQGRLRRLRAPAQRLRPRTRWVCARGVRGCAWPPAPTRTGHERHRGRDKGSRPHAHSRAGSEGGKALGTRGGPGRRPWGSGGELGGGLPALWRWCPEGGGWGRWTPSCGRPALTCGAE